MSRCIPVLMLALIFANLGQAQTPPAKAASPREPIVRGTKPLTEPNTLPNKLTASAVSLPQRENLTTFDTGSLMVSRAAGEWILTLNGFSFKTYGDSGDDAQEALRTFRDLAPQQWGTIGTVNKPVVEYGLTRDAEDRVIGVRGSTRTLTPIDVRTLRIEMVRGASVLRDDANLLLNFGPHPSDAQQAFAVIHKYGFNAIGTVGRTHPMTYLLTTSMQITNPSKLPPGVVLAAQAQTMQRTGLMVPGVGVVGEQITIDPRKLEVKRVEGQVALLSGTEVIAKFGYDEWTAREAQRVFHDMKITEMCAIGTQGLTIYLSRGRPLKAMPIYTRGTRFDPADLRVMELGGQWRVIDGIGRVSLPAATKDEAEQLLKVIRSFKLDQICTIGHGTRHALTVLAQER